MNIVESFFFLLALALSLLFGTYFFTYIGWWAVPPALILGFGVVLGILKAMNKLFGRRSERQHG